MVSLQILLRIIISTAQSNVFNTFLSLSWGATSIVLQIRDRRIVIEATKWKK